MKVLFHKIEQYTTYVLTVAAMIYVVMEIFFMCMKLFEILKVLFTQGLSTADALLSAHNIGGAFFSILIALELMETLKHFGEEHIVKARVIILICIIAVSRKLISIDFKHSDYLTDIGLAVLIIALTGGYYLLSGRFAAARNKSQDD